MKRVEELVCGLVDDALSPEEAGEFDRLAGAPATDPRDPVAPPDVGAVASVGIAAPVGRMIVTYARIEAALRGASPPPDLRAAIMERVRRAAAERPMTRPRRPWLALAASVLAVAGVACYAGLKLVASGRGDTPVCSVSMLRGNVWLGRSATDVAEVRARQGDTVVSGGRFWTGSGSEVVLDAGGGQAIVTLFAGTELAVVAEGRKEGEGMLVDLSAGEVDVHILRKGYTSVVRTPAGTARAVGTQFRVKLMAGKAGKGGAMNKVMLVTVASGLVMVGQAELRAGDQVVVDGGQVRSVRVQPVVASPAPTNASSAAVTAMPAMLYGKVKSVSTSPSTLTLTARKLGDTEPSDIVIGLPEAVTVRSVKYVNQIPSYTAATVAELKEGQSVEVKMNSKGVAESVTIQVR